MSTWIGSNTEGIEYVLNFDQFRHYYYSIIQSYRETELHSSDIYGINGGHRGCRCSFGIYGEILSSCRNSCTGTGLRRHSCTGTGIGRQIANVGKITECTTYAAIKCSAAWLAPLLHFPCCNDYHAHHPILQIW